MGRIEEAFNIKKKINRKASYNELKGIQKEAFLVMNWNFKQGGLI